MQSLNWGMKQGLKGQELRSSGPQFEVATPRQFEIPPLSFGGLTGPQFGVVCGVLVSEVEDLQRSNGRKRKPKIRTWQQRQGLGDGSSSKCARTLS